MRNALAAILLAAAVSGCLGGGGSSDEDRRAAIDRWTATIDGICKRTAQRVAAQPPPPDIESIPTAIADAAVEVSRGRGEMASHDPPRGARRGQAFIDQLARVDPLLAGVEAAGASGDVGRLGPLAYDLRIEAELASDYARQAGLRACGDASGLNTALSAVEGVAFYADLTTIDRQLARRIRKLPRRPSTREEAIAFYAGFDDALGQALGVPLKTPESAASEERRWRKAMEAVQTLAGDVVGELEDRSVITPDYAAAVERRFRALDRRLRERFTALLRVVNDAAAPLLPEGASLSPGESRA